MKNNDDFKKFFKVNIAPVKDDIILNFTHHVHQIWGPHEALSCQDCLQMFKSHR